MTSDKSDIDDDDVSHRDNHDTEEYPDNEPDITPIPSRYGRDTGVPADLTCPYCDTTVNSKGEEFANYPSLRGHITRSHKVSMSEDTYIAVMAGDVEPPTPGVSKTKKAKAKKTARTTYSSADPARVEKVDVDFDEPDAEYLADLKREELIAAQEQKTVAARSRRYSGGRRGSGYRWENDAFGRGDHQENDPVQEEILRQIKQRGQIDNLKRLSRDSEDEYGSVEELRDVREELSATSEELQESEKLRIEAESRADKLEQKIEFMQMIEDKVEPLKAELREEKEKRREAERARVDPVDKFIDKATDMLDGGVVGEIKDVAKAARHFVEKGDIPKVRPISEAPQRKRVVSNPDGEWKPSIFDHLMFTNPDGCDATDEEKKEWFLNDGDKMIIYMEKQMANESVSQKSKRIEAEKYEKHKAQKEGALTNE